LIALGLIVSFIVGEVVAGILGHSLALLSDTRALGRQLLSCGY
jgi:Co/Zn/Cd efflux system component